jgi:hypothetical protein
VVDITAGRSRGLAWEKTMTTVQRKRCMSALAILATGCLYGEGCQPRSIADNLATQTTTRLGNLFLDALVFHPVQDALADATADK